MAASTNSIKVGVEMTLGHPRLRVAMVSSEIAPFAKTGGLGDMVASFAKALDNLGIQVSLIMPGYRSVLYGGFPLTDTGIRLTVRVSNRQEEVTLKKGTMGSSISVYFICADRYFDRDYLYGGPEGDYPDNAERFVFFTLAALEVLKLKPPDILHAHDWQSALAITFMKAQPHLYPQLYRVKTVLTIHNLGFQGLFPNSDWHLLGLDDSLFTPKALEFYGKINFLKGGIVFADRVTTVSPTYAEEIKTAVQGFGLDGLLRERAPDLVGILNGADYEVWNPESDGYITRTYSAGNLSGKKLCKRDLQRIFNLPEIPGIPLIGAVSRLTTQKGYELVQKASDKLLSRDIQYILLGTGDKTYTDFFSGLSRRYPDKVGVRIAFEESLSHKVIAGSDMFLMPSLYEPSGLTQIYSLKYGTVPIVRATGGLKDTVADFNPKTDKGNGFVFGPYESGALMEAVDRALYLFGSRDKWSTLMRNAMEADFSWDRSAGTYSELYRKLL